MQTSYDVRIWTNEVYKGKTTTTHWVRWRVAGKRHKQPFKSAALADSFRSELVTAARKGEPFDVQTGQPLSLLRSNNAMDWLTFACKFADMKWPGVAGTTRRTHAEALAKVTVAMLKDSKAKPADELIRHALNRWAFNPLRRNSSDMPVDVRKALRWVEGHVHDASALKNPKIVRGVLDGLTLRLDGRPGAPSVVSRQRRIFNTAIEYAVELGILEVNPIPRLKWSAPKVSMAVDRRSVANPVQVRTLLHAVREGRNGSRLVAFFGCLYFAALRPEEVAGLRKRNLVLPEDGWGELHLDRAEPHAGKEWTDSGQNRDDRQLKQRAVGEGRTVPCPPELTALLQEHIGRFGFGDEGRLFRGARNKIELPKGTIIRAWQEARRAAFTPEVCASPLAATPYDLRHAAVSTWLNGGVPAADVAGWAGHSVEILLKIYAKCLDGSAAVLRKRVQAALGHE